MKKTPVIDRLSTSLQSLGFLCAWIISSCLDSLKRSDMPYGGSIHNQATNLQSTISAATSGVGDSIVPHHPICCATGSLYYDEDRTFSCDHAAVPPDDPRTQSALNHSMVLLILEPAIMNQEWRYKTPDQLAYEWLEKTGEEWK